MFLFYKRFLQLQTCKKKNEPKCFLYSTWCSLCFTLPHCLFLWLDTRFEIDLLWLKLRLVFNQSPEHSSPFSSQCIRTQPAEYQPNPSTVLLVIFSFFFLFFTHRWLSFTLADFIYACTHTNTGYSAIQTCTMTVFSGDRSISVTIIHHQVLNMQIVLISMQGDSITYSNVPPLFKFTLIYIHITDPMPALLLY